MRSSFRVSLAGMVLVACMMGARAQQFRREGALEFLDTDCDDEDGYISPADLINSGLTLLQTPFSNDNVRNNNNQLLAPQLRNTNRVFNPTQRECLQRRRNRIAQLGDTNSRFWKYSFDKDTIARQNQQRNMPLFRPPSECQDREPPESCKQAKLEGQCLPS